MSNQVATDWIVEFRRRDSCEIGTHARKWDDGGAGGGEIIAVGTPEAIAATKKSYSGQALATPLPERGMRTAARRASS